MALDITISGTFDIAQARQTIRRLSSDEGWTGLLKVRSIAALTALAEVLYFGYSSRFEQPLHIALESLHQTGKQGIEFYAETNFDEVCQHYATAEWQLQRTCDEMVVQSAENGDLVVLRLWAMEGHG